MTRPTSPIDPRRAAAAAAILLAVQLRADEWAILGPRALGMGGAGVARTRDSSGVGGGGRPGDL